MNRKERKVRRVITDLTYAVECSADLLTWGSPEVAAVLLSTVDGLETWQAKQSLGTTPTAFFRLKVTK